MYTKHPFPKEELIFEGRVFNALALYSFLKRLVTPFSETEAFKLGIIDKDGKNLIPKKDLKTSEEKAAYTYYDVLIFNLKKLLEMLPFGKQRLASYAAALLLLREEKLPESQELLSEFFEEFFEEVQQDVALLETINTFMRHEESALLRYINKRTIREETPANAVGSGNIAGTGHDGEDPVVPHRKKKKKVMKRDDIEKIDG